MLIEHFMLGLPGTEFQLRELLIRLHGEKGAARFWRTFRRAMVSSPDLRWIRKQGLNHVRIPFNHRLWLRIEGPESRATLFDELTRLLDGCARHGLLAILDLHTAPGGQNPDWHSDNGTGSAEFWDDPAAADTVVELWTEIARRFRDHPALGGYDLLNEPACTDRGSAAKRLRALYARILAGIRSVDTEHVVFLEGDFYATDLSALEKIADDHTAASIHFYPFFNRPKLEGLSYQGLMAELRKGLMPAVLEAKHRLKMPLWCGETGFPDQPEHNKANSRIFEATLAVMNDLEISWAVWAYKDCGSMGMLRPARSSAWQSLRREVCPPWDFFGELAQCMSAGREHIERTCPGTVVDTRLEREAAYRLMALRQLALVKQLEEKLKQIPLERLLSAAECLASSRGWMPPLRALTKHSLT
ncbi:glycoside hydrolase family 5 protein [Nibricoccus sp. IMCC34717]|uniref:glycoside hydrolase family 5 protein n=1 Tax=Nibricoccus sp. IMCC34717 TaxID=3034021 RepID=UPI0038501935